MLKFTRRSLLLALGKGLLTYGGLFLYGNQIEMHRPFVMRTKIPIENLHDDLVGFRIVVMGDLHIDPMWNIALIDRAFTLANQTEADAIAFVGDYVTYEASAIDALKDQFSQLHAKHGVFACLGNHEFWTDAQVTRTALKDVGITVLENSQETIKAGKAALTLAGLQSVWGANPNLSKALSDAEPGAPVVLLMHEPDYADITAQDGRVNLQLSGHSHGGQLHIPFFGHVYSAANSRKYPVGLYRVGDMWQYTTRGIGVSPSVPFRINCPPEVTEIELVRA